MSQILNECRWAKCVKTRWKTLGQNFPWTGFLVLKAKKGEKTAMSREVGNNGAHFIRTRQSNDSQVLTHQENQR